VSALAQTWDLAARANRLEGEVASYTRKLEALERRGRALRAEIGRKVEELAHEESRVMREAAADGEDVEKVRVELAAAEKIAGQARQLADAAARQGNAEPSIYERAGAAAATAQAKREQLGRYENKKAAREANARDLRRQIEELRGQLARYAEALEEDLAQGREKVAARTREGLAFERAFSESSNLLLGHLRNKPECRDLVSELLNIGPSNQSNPNSMAVGDAEGKVVTRT
jgi:serine/threonine-protein kinase